MSDTIAPIFPKKLLPPIVFALALTMLSIGSARLLGYAPPPSLPANAAIETKILQFEDAPGGTVIVRDAKTGELINTYGRGEGSFIRAALRALVNDRKHKGATGQGGFRLERHAGPQLFLIDEVTGKTLSLNAFGPANTAAFAALMSNQKEGEGQ